MLKQISAVTPVLKQKNIAKARDDFEKDFKENAGKHDDMIKYQGF